MAYVKTVYLCPVCKERYDKMNDAIACRNQHTIESQRWAVGAGGKKVLIHECSAPNSWGSEQWALRESELSDVIPERKKQLEAREAQEQSNDDERA